MDNEANLSCSNKSPSILNPEDPDTMCGDFIDQIDYKTCINVKKALDMLCSIPQSERTRRIKLCMPRIEDKDYIPDLSKINRQKKALFSKHVRLVIYSFLSWHQKVFDIAILSQEERLILGSALARGSESPLELEINGKMLLEERPNEWRRWISSSFSLVQKVKFQFNPSDCDSSATIVAQRLGEVLGCLPRDVQVSLDIKILEPIYSQEEEPELLQHFDFEGIIQTAREHNEDFKLDLFKVTNTFFMKLSTWEFKLMLNRCSDLELQTILIGEQGHKVTLTEPSPVKELRLKLVRFKCSIHGVLPAPRVCHVEREMRDRGMNSMFVDNILDLSQAEDVKLSLTDQELSEPERLHRFQAMFEKMVCLQHLEIRRFYKGEVNQLFPLHHMQKLQTLKIEVLSELQSLETILSTEFRSTETQIYCFDQLYIDFKLEGHCLLEEEPVLTNKYRNRPVFKVSAAEEITEAQQRLCETFEITDKGLVQIEGRRLLNGQSPDYLEFFHIVIKNKTTAELLKIFIFIEEKEKQANISCAK